MATNNNDEFVRNEAPCLTCRHLLGFPYCNAFPKGIPPEIQRGDNQHDRPYPGDNGIQFEKLPPKGEDSGKSTIGLGKLKEIAKRRKNADS